MKNITIMEKTIIEKTTIAKITTTALLFFLALFTLTTCLVAQESGQTRKQGWFVGVSPFSFVGSEIKTSRTTTTAVDTAVGSAASFEYEATIVSNFFNNSRGLTNGVITDAEAKQSLIMGAIELCKRSDAADATTGRIEDTVPLDPNSAVNTDYPTIDTRDFYIGYWGGNRTSLQTTEICHLPASATLPAVSDGTTTDSLSSESAISLQGALAIQFGYNLEKYRVSLTSFSNKAGANRLTNNVLLADWFLAPGFYAGLGITSAKLETEIGSASQTAPAFNLGYARKIGNLQLEAGYLVLNSSFSIQKQQTSTPETNTQTLPLGEAQTQTLGQTYEENRIVGFQYIDTNSQAYISVVSVTRTPVAAATVTTTTTTTITEKVELPSQQVIYLRLVWKFR